MIILLGGGIYLHTLSFNFTYLDDYQLIVGNYYFNKNLVNIPLAFLKSVFCAPDSTLYRPIMNILFILEAQIGGKEPLVYHLTNVVLHIIASCLLFSLLSKLKNDKTLSILFSLVFTVHPALVSNVAWIPGRNDVLLAIFTLLWFMSFINFSAVAFSWLYFLLQTIFFLLAIFTKETALLIPFIGLSFLILTRQRLLSKKNVLLYLVWALSISLWLLLRHHALTNTSNATQFSEIKKLIHVVPIALVQYIGKMFLPLHLSPLPTIKDTPIVYGAISILLLSVMIFTTKSRYPNLILGLLWLILFLLPPFIVYLSNYGILTENRIYLPLVGVMILLLESDLIKNLRKKKYLLISTSLLIIATFSLITYKYSNIFKDKIHFWEYAVKTSPRLTLAYRILGAMYHREGLLEKAEEKYKQALSINPNEIEVHSNLGLIYLEKGLYKEAEEEFKKELMLNPTYAGVYYNYGLLCFRTGRLKEAKWFLQKALQLNPEIQDILSESLSAQTSQQQEPHTFLLR